MTDQNDPDPKSEKKQDPDATVVDATVIGSRPAGGLTGTLREGDPIGPYTVVRELGEGGFGSVYLCEQVKPVKRKVAVKIIKAGMDSKAVLARFDAERQALAVLNHPSIAKVFDAGVTENHRPYFVMEYVAGVPINEFCDDRKLDTRTRLELFAKVCDGMQHAHQKGIIHRDLKPGNILVYAEDGEDPQPKIIDFGIAKATGEDLTEETLVTQMGQMMGTPEYMSPEQASGLVNDIDTRTDVYSLGVVLYQLICGRLPFEPDELRARGYSEIQRIICEEDPPRPAEKFTSVSQKADETTEEIAAARNTTIVALTSSLRKELEWIPLKALRKEPEQRYASAESFGEDVRRYLKGEALEAGPETTSYRLKKTLKRYRGPVTAAALVATAMVVATVISISFGYEASRQRDLASTALADSQTKTKQLETVAEFQVKQLSGIDVPAFGESLRRSMIRELDIDSKTASGADFTGSALNLLDEHIFDRTQVMIDEELVDQPLIQAQLLQAMATSRTSLGLIDEAEDPQIRALKLREEHLGDQDPLTIESLIAMGTLMVEMARFDEADQHLNRALDLCLRTMNKDHPLTQRTKIQIGQLLSDRGLYEQSNIQFMDVVEIRKRTLGDDHVDTLDVQSLLMSNLSYTGPFDVALEYGEGLLRGYESAYGEESEEVAYELNNVGHLMLQLARYEDAVPILERSLAIYRLQRGDGDPDTILPRNNLGQIMEKMGRREEAMSHYEAALNVSRLRLGPDHRYTAWSLGLLGRALTEQGRFEEALLHLQEQMDISYRAFGDVHPLTSSSHWDLAHWHESQGYLDEAIDHYMKDLAICRILEANSGGVVGSVAMTCRDIGRLYVSQNKFESAQLFLDEAYQDYIEIYGSEHPETISTLRVLVDLYEGWHESAPDAGHDSSADDYRRLLMDSSG